MTLSAIAILLTFIHLVYSDLLPVPENSRIIPYDDENNCYGRTGVIGCSDDCLYQKYCVNDEMLFVNCYKQTLRKHCDATNNNQCATTIKVCNPDKYDFQCPQMDGYYPHPYNCARFYGCSYGMKTEYECNNYVFNPKLNKCTPNTKCYNFSPYSPGKCYGKQSTVVLHPLDNSLAIYCDTNPKLIKCYNRFKLNTKTLFCEPDCISIGKKRIGDPEMQECFYECSSLLKYDYKCCSFGFTFDENIQTCV